MTELLIDCSFFVILIEIEGDIDLNSLSSTFRDCKIGTIYEGTSNIQMNTIAKLIDHEYQHKVKV